MSHFLPVPVLSFSKSSGTRRVAKSENPTRPLETRRGPLPVQHSMEKVAGGSRSCQNRAGRSAASLLFRWKKSAPEPPKEDAKPPVGKGSRRHEKESPRTDSPSRVSVLLEAWEKGLVGTDPSEAPDSADGRRSRSPGQALRVRFPKDAPPSPSPPSTRSSSSPSASSADARKPFSPEDPRRSFSSAEGKQPLSAIERGKPLFPAETRWAFSPGVNRRPCFLGDLRRPHSPADARRSFSPEEGRRCHSPADTKRSPSPAGTRRSFSPSAALQSLSPANGRRFGLLADSPGLPSSGSSSQNSPSPVGSPHSSPRAENHCASSPVDAQYTSPSPDTRCFPSVADMRRLYSSVDSRRPSSPTSTRQPFSSGETRYMSSPSNTGCSSSLADNKWLFLPAEAKCLSSSVDARRSSSSADISYSSPSPGAEALSYTEDAKPSSSPEESGRFSPTSAGTRSHSHGPQRDFTAHGPVFAQVYSPASKSKSQGNPEMQEGRSIIGTLLQGENHFCDATNTPLATGLHRENTTTSTDRSQVDDCPPSDVNHRTSASQRDSPVASSGSTTPVLESFGESLSPHANLPRSQTENYPSRSASTALSCGGSYVPNATSASLEESRALSILPCVVGSSTVAQSQTQWYGANGSSMVVLRSERQVVIPQAGTATVYRAGREVVLSSARVESMSQPQPERFPSISNSCIPSNEDWPLQGGLPEIKTPQGFLSSFSDAHGCSQTWPPESFMTQTRSAETSDAQGQRCTLAPIPSFPSNRDATTASEGVAPLWIPERDSSLYSETAFQRHSSLCPASGSERNPSMALPGSPVASGPEEDNGLSGAEEASTLGSQGIRCSSDAAEETGIFRMPTEPQVMAPSDEEDTSQSELGDGERGPRKDNPTFASESDVLLAEGPNSSQESLSQNTGSSNRSAEPEPEEVVDMDLFVDTLRNMEPADLRKPLKHLPRPPKPSALVKHTPLPPIHEDHVATKSQLTLPAALGELFTLTEERHTEEEPKKDEAAVDEEDMEEIENPYPSTDGGQQDKNQARTTYPWENKTFKTEEEIGSFLGKLKQSLGEPESKGMAPKSIANQTNMIRANILKGISLLSIFSDKKAVEDSKPYSRLDNSLLYSRFMSPDKTQLKDTAKGKEGRSSLVFSNPAGVKAKREGQASPHGPWLEGTYERLSCESLSSGRPDPSSSRVPGASRSSKGLTALVKEAKTASWSEVQVSWSVLDSKVKRVGLAGAAVVSQGGLLPSV